MADNQPGRPREAGDRHREQRQRARRLTGRQDFWAVDDDRGGRVHRRSRVALQLRRRS
jgi:hypothetical protein